MPTPKPLQHLLARDMSRREFLGFMGVALLGVIGITGLMRNLNHAIDRDQTTGQRSNSYGGNTNGR